MRWGLLAVLALPAITQAEADEASPSLCGAGEQTVFACTVAKSHKLASVCRIGEQLVYRFGKPSKIELVYPEEKIAAAKRFAFERVPFSHGVDCTLRFENKGTTYSVWQHQNTQQDEDYSEIDITQPDPAHPKTPKQIATVKCESYDAEWDLLKGLLDGA